MKGNLECNQSNAVGFATDRLAKQAVMSPAVSPPNASDMRMAGSIKSPSIYMSKVGVTNDEGRETTHLWEPQWGW